MRDTKSLEQAGKVASEAVENIRTLQCLNKQMIFHRKYCEQLVQPHKYFLDIFGQILISDLFLEPIWFRRMSMAWCSPSPNRSFSSCTLWHFGLAPFLCWTVQWVRLPFFGTIFLDKYLNSQTLSVFFAIAFCGQSVGQIRFNSN